MQTKPTNISISQIVIIIALIFNLLFLFLIQGQANTLSFLKTELKTLKQDEKILLSAQNLESQYSEEIEIISRVFPTESTILLFVEQLEKEIQKNTPEYSVKFASVSPVAEKDVAYLPLTISFKGDLSAFAAFLRSLEVFPYITYISKIVVKSPEGFTNKSEIIIQLKVYVNTPFNS